MSAVFEHVNIDGSSMTVRPARSLRRYVPTDFEVSYDPPIDLASIPEQIRLLPYLWNVAPLVWALDLELSVDVLDARVVESFDAIRNELRDMYPALGWRGAIRPQAVVSTPDPEPTEVTMAALFSGGVDSIWTALRHSGKHVLLVSVWGTHVAVSDKEAWAVIAERNGRFAAAHAGGLAVVRSNLRELDYSQLRTLTPEIPGWWPYVQHGMAYTGLTAPLLYRHGIPLLQIASTYTTAFTTSWASLPRIDNRISLGTAQVHQDSFELSRQDKLERIVDCYREQDMRPPELRVCWDAQRSNGGNCELCEKCVRTMVGLWIAGADPVTYGFPRFQPSVLEALPTDFEAFRYRFTEDQVFMWSDMKAHLPPVEVLDGPVWSWMRRFDFQAYMDAQPKRHLLSRKQKTALRTHTPRLYGLAHSLRRRLTRG